MFMVTVSISILQIDLGILPVRALPLSPLANQTSGIVVVDLEKNMNVRSLA